MKKIVFCLLIFSGLSLIEATAADNFIIANKNVPDTELSQEEVRKIFLGKLRKWKDHSKVKPAVPKDSDSFKPFLKQFLHKSETQYRTYWKRMIFTGKGVPPKSFETEAELLTYVAETKGSIACVRPASVPEGGSSEIKIIKIKKRKGAPK